MSDQPNLFEDSTLKAIKWHPSRSAGLMRLSKFLPYTAQQYSQNRNFDLGSSDRSNISALSPWIKYRLVEETEILREVGKAHSFSSAEKFMQEVFWRGYFKGWLEHNPDVWNRFKADINRLRNELSSDLELNERLETGLQGKTGIECFDIWVKELLTTGYLHNHARMWFASIWIFTLKLPWQLGAKFFYQNLLDGDIASNTLSWRWVGGLHTKGKTYLARASNIEKFTNGRFNPGGQLSHEARPLTESNLSPTEVLSKFPAVITLEQSQRIGLLISSEDCRPETLNLSHNPVAVLCCTQAGEDDSLMQSIQVRNFKVAAIADAALRAEEHYQSKSEQYDGDAWIKYTLEWAKRHQLAYVVTPYASVGPLADQVNALRIILEENGMSLHQITREYDQLVWPHAQKGFFKLKAQIPNFLESLKPPN